MMKLLSTIVFLLFGIVSINAQTPPTDSLKMGGVSFHKDARLDILAQKEAVYYEALNNPNGPRIAKGYRLMVLNTTDRTYAMSIRSKLLQRYPDQKVYMSFQPPYIKLKFGNFAEKADAEKVKKELSDSKIITNNIYVVPENVELKGDKNKDKEKDL